MDPPDNRTAMLLAAERAVAQGAEMMRQGRGHVGALIPKGDRDFATAVDVAVEEEVKRRLREEFPAIPFLGEEEGGAGLSEPALWVLDPIDGTVNFARGSPLCAISLALVEQGQPTLAVVEVPLLGERFVAAAGGGTHLNGQRIGVSAVERPAEAAVSVNDFAIERAAAEHARVQRRLVQELARTVYRVRMHGSEAIDLAWLAAGRIDAALILSNLPWDVSGGVLLVREAGGVVSDVDGEPHGPDSRYTLATAPALQEPLLELVRSAERDGSGA